MKWSNPLFQRLARLVKVRAIYADPTEQQQAQRLLFINLLWIAAVVMISPLMLTWLLEAKSVDTATAFTPITLLLAGLNYRLIQRGQLNWARPLFVLNVLMASFLSMLPDYRIDTGFILALSIPLTAAGVLLRRWGLLGIALLIVAITVAAGVIQIQIGMESTPIGNTTSSSITTTIYLVLGVVLVNGTILWTFVTGTENISQQYFRLRQLLERSSQINKSIIALPGAMDRLDDTIEQLRDTLGLYHVQVFLSDPATGLAVLQASTGFVGRRLMEEESLLIPDESSPVNDALRKPEPIIILDSSPAERQIGFLPATRSEVLFPLRIGDRMPLGVLDLHSTSPDTFSPSMLQAVATIAHHLATALHSVEQERELHARTIERNRLAEQIDATQRELVRLNRQLVGATWGTYIEERRDLTPSFEWVQKEHRPVQRGESPLLKMTLEDGQPRLEQRRGQDVLCVPIRLRGQLLGAIEFQRPSEVGWSPSALELAQAVAERLALSLENARLFEHAQMTARREQLVSQVTAQMQTTNDLQSLLSVAAAQFQDALGATATSIRLEPSILEKKQEQENASAPS